MKDHLIENETCSSRPAPAHPVLDITLYTDPLCCWSWAIAPHLQRLRQYLGKSAIWTYRMGGLIPSWKSFSDEMNAVTRAAQMGPVWMHAAQLTDRPIHYQVWMTDPPASSYPACIATKAAGLQSELQGQQYYHLAQQACMLRGKNIARQDILFQVADDLALQDPAFDGERFRTDYAGDNAREAFRADLELVRYYHIGRFPTLLIRSGEKDGLILSGFRPYADLVQAIRAGLPDVPIGT